MPIDSGWLVRRSRKKSCSSLDRRLALPLSLPNDARSVEASGAQRRLWQGALTTPLDVTVGLQFRFVRGQGQCFRMARVGGPRTSPLDTEEQLLPKGLGLALQVL